MKHMVRITCDECGAETVAVVKDGLARVKPCLNCSLSPLDMLRHRLTVQQRQRLDEQLQYGTGVTVIKG